MLCLRVKGEDRPTMREVARELEGLRIPEKHSWDRPITSEEKEFLLKSTPHFENVDGGGTTELESMNQISLSLFGAR
ncbi:hypothetical protein L6164_023434 [Bauhinia variegata]|uniref:Uncharacterized protein n=1 Tax=Bauhinia variegata TaxID=167791 RepID=A0ACB9MK70_BAUVA|nr:hypothetical protein L6164_023434 [Bauhinia variegata]